MHYLPILPADLLRVCAHNTGALDGAASEHHHSLRGCHRPGGEGDHCWWCQKGTDSYLNSASYNWLTPQLSQLQLTDTPTQPTTTDWHLNSASYNWLTPQLSQLQLTDTSTQPTTTDWHLNSPNYNWLTPQLSQLQLTDTSTEPIHAFYIRNL